MNVDRAELGAPRAEELVAAPDERTLAILDRRRRSTVVKGRGWLVRRTLLLADIVGLSVAFLAVQVLFNASGPPNDRIGSATELVVFLVTLPAWVVVAKLYGLYGHDEERTDHSTVDDVVGVLHLVTVGTWLLFAGAWLSGLADPHFPKLMTFWAVAIAFIGLGRAVARAFCRRRLAYVQNAVIVGAGDVGQLVARKLLQHPEYGINLVGFIDSDPREPAPGLEHVAMLGGLDRLPAIVRLLDVERVMIAFSNEHHEEILGVIRALKKINVQVDIVPRFFEVVGANLAFHTVAGLPLLGMPPLRLAPSSRILKRVLDVVVSIVGLIMLAPLFVFLAWRIKVNSPGPVFFRQLRMGVGNKTFRIYKFRTMTLDADERRAEVAHLNMHAHNGGDARMFKIPDDPRITSFGRFLRRYSLDELPQLLNVLKGDMSLVGPRPLPLDEDERVLDWGRHRLDLKPGVTGLWQVLGRSDIPFGEMLQLDYIYVTNWSLFNDLKLILRTVPVLFGARGAY